MVARIARPLILLSFLGLLTGCSATSLKVETAPFSKGNILILPPRDAFNDARENSGAEFGERMVGQLEERAWSASTYPADGDVGHATPVTAEQALRCGREQGAEYALTITLGKARDAAAFTGPIPDYVFLDDATLYDCATGEVVWKLVKPFRADSSNVTRLYPSYRFIAKLLADSLTKQVADS